MKSTLALVGCGHIGGSLAFALRAAAAVREIVGWDRDPAHLARATQRGIVDRAAASAADAVAGADVVVLAVPVRAAPEVLAEIAPALPPRALVLDVGSTKRSTLAAARATLPHPERFVGCHPIAGTERSGPDAADGALFRGRKVLLVPAEGTDPAALAEARRLWEHTGAEPRVVSSEEHDRVVAAVSHLPHVAAFALAAAVRDLTGAIGPAAEGMAAGGLRDTTRIAASDPVMWRDIFLDNRENVLAAFASLEVKLKELEDAIRCMNDEQLLSWLEAARRARGALVQG